jgi:hypothetical protein
VPIKYFDIEKIGEDLNRAQEILQAADTGRPGGISYFSQRSRFFA